jgi:hypothetical protein
VISTIQRVFRGFMVLCLAAAAIYVLGTASHSLLTRGDLSEFLDHYLTVDHYMKELRGR